MDECTVPKEFNDANIRAARRFKAERDALVKALESASIQCGNVIYNCEQKPADNRRHLDSWCSVKAFIDTALRNAAVGGAS